MRHPMIRVACAAVALGACAAPATGSVRPAAHEDIRDGRVTVGGTGTATLTGAAVAYGTLAGGGALAVRDLGAGDLRSRVRVSEGDRRGPVRSATHAATRRGTIRFVVDGGDFRLRVRSRRMTLCVVGDAVLVLTGRGRLTTDDGRTRRWSGPTRLVLGDGPPPHASPPQYRR